VFKEKPLKRCVEANIYIQSSIDLHGYTKPEAEKALLLFIKTCTEKHHRVINIVHGKGSSKGERLPTLKNTVNALLQNHPTVLAFCSALPQDGGTGAVYVLLKKL
jgi:DNA-nicking Smr family endonuclease